MDGFWIAVLLGGSVGFMVSGWPIPAAVMLGAAVTALIIRDDA